MGYRSINAIFMHCLKATSQFPLCPFSLSRQFCPLYFYYVKHGFLHCTTTVSSFPLMLVRIPLKRIAGHMLLTASDTILLMECSECWFDRKTIFVSVHFEIRIQHLWVVGQKDWPYRHIVQLHRQINLPPIILFLSELCAEYAGLANNAMSETPR